MLILILGGTTEASILAAGIAERSGIKAIVSLAGRTTAPKPLPLPTRTGGFGGVSGLTRWLQENRVGAVVDATHPYAAVMSRNAAEACTALGIPLLGLRRPAWHAGPGDRWIEVATMAEAVRALGLEPRRVFLTVGRLELSPFVQAPQHHYVVRTIEAIGDALPVPHLTAIRDRGPFDEETELTLMVRQGIDVVVTKNSGGPATYGKIAAARALGVPVVMVARPDKPPVASVERPDQALVWIDMLLAQVHGCSVHGCSPVLRGV